MEGNVGSNADSSLIHCKSQKLLSHSLSTVSTSDIRSFINRVNFYLEHFSIVNRKQKSPSVENKIMFLKKISKHLKEEIRNRNILTTEFVK